MCDGYGIVPGFSDAGVRAGTLTVLASDIPKYFGDWNTHA